MGRSHVSPQKTGLKGSMQMYNLIELTRDQIPLLLMGLTNKKNGGKKRISSDFELEK